MGVFRSKPYRAGRNEAQESEDEHAARRGVVTSMHDFQPVQSVAFVNGQEGRPTCVTGDSQGLVRLIHYNHRQIVNTWKHGRSITKVTASKQSNFCASSGRDDVINFWREGQEEADMELHGHEMAVTALSIQESQSPSHLLSGSRDSCVAVWDISTGTLLDKRRISRNLVTSVCHSPAEPNIAGQCGEDRMVKLWDTRQLEVAVEFPRKHQIQLCCDINKTGTIASSSAGQNGLGGEVTIFDRRKALQFVAELQSADISGSCTGCVFLSPSFPDLLASIYEDGIVKLWNTATKEVISSLALEQSGGLTSLAWNDETRQLLVSSYSGVLFLLDFVDRPNNVITLNIEF